VIDTCTTTTVVVKQGIVAVTGFGHTTPKHATVTAGQRVILRAG
jgi:ferric-dicitrate binding protein FerR (iron transport regulator)